MPLQSKPLTVCVITAARSEYGLLRWPMQAIADDTRFRLKIIAAAAHLEEQYGLTYREIEADGFKINARIPASFGNYSGKDLATAVGEMTKGFACAFDELKPDVVLVMGDRYELLAVSAACVLMTIPLAHISGGEITEGAIDDQVRHSLTKSAHLHFVANDVYAARLRQMGEEPWRICVSGEPGLDNLHKLVLMNIDELSNNLGMDLSRPTALVTYHPTTLDNEDPDKQIETLLSALKMAGLQYVLTYPNADAGSPAIIKALQRFCETQGGRAVLFKNLGQNRYLSMLRHAAMMIGNASSGIFEAPSFNLPVVNVGSRQSGRLRATNIVDVSCDANEIRTAIKRALDYDRTSICVNLYGDGQSSPRIRDFVFEAFAARSRTDILHKRFVDCQP